MRIDQLNNKHIKTENLYDFALVFIHHLKEINQIIWQAWKHTFK